MESSIRQHAAGVSFSLGRSRVFLLLGPGAVLAGAALRGLQRGDGA
jgi:hypothetical protein